MELPNIDDLLDLNSHELAFESADTVAVNTANETTATSAFNGSSDTSTAVDFAIGQVQTLNDNIQTEAIL
ncbi:MAG: hypothetical protein ACTH5M_03675 [Psychrobacter sp.]|uniref:hypothetical protein n=1 Tax=Psychrobacter sp. AOP7-B1-24 TaxID=3457645 RepID=UPI003FB7DBA8